MHYCYNNINHLENLEYYKNLGLEEMERSEYTSLILGYFEDSAAIIQDIIEYFGGGWMDENDQELKPLFNCLLCRAETKEVLWYLFFPFLPYSFDKK